MPLSASTWLRWSAMASLSLSLTVAAVPPAEITAQEPLIGDVRLDLTRNQLIDDADAAKVMRAWTSVEERGSCITQELASRDVNGSGCIDIADLQQVLAHWGTSTDARVAVPDRDEASINAGPEATFTVNSTGYESDANLADGVCATVVGSCTLRAAIEQANNRSGRELIAFNILNGDGSCPSLVTIEAPADATTGYEIDDQYGDGMTIDGYTQCGASPNTRGLHDPNGGNAVIKIELKGNQRQDVNGLEIDTGKNIVRGLAIYNWDFQMILSYWPSSNNRIEGNFLGTNAANTFRYETTSPWGEDHHEGLRIQGTETSGAAFNIIGGTEPAQRNIIAGNRKDGIKIQGHANNNRIIGNYIGLKQDGKTPLRNATDAVDFEMGPQHNVLGGNNPGEGNVISGNYSEGIEISHGTDTQFNSVIGNYFGLSADGSKAVPNGGSGITFEDAVDSNYAYNNVIAGNGTSGVFFFVLATRNQVIGNKIGVGPDGVTPIPNGRTSLVDPYYERSGIVIMGGSQHNLIKSNIIANHAGDAVVLKNTSDSDHGGVGQTYFNTISQNSMYNNGNTEEDDVEGDGIVLERHDDTASYPNERLPQPTISSAATNRVRGTARLRSGAACANCTIEVFIADKTTTSDPSGDNAGEGKTYVANGKTDGSGNFSIAICTGALSVGKIVTATTTDTRSNTSQFSTNITVGAPVTPDPCLSPSPSPSPSPTPRPQWPRRAWFPMVRR